METTPTFTGLACTDCGRAHDATATGGCADCGAPLAGEYDLDAVTLPPADAPATDLFAVGDLLPIGPDVAADLGAGGTPAVDCPALADDLGVAAVSVKDEGANPTGVTWDRGAALAVGAAAAAGEARVALASPGDDGQSIAAHAARAGLDCDVFVPSRAGFVRKAMVNVHGAEMEVVGGRYPDAVAACEEYREASADVVAEPVPADCSPFGAPFRLEGAKTTLFELVLGPSPVPDAVVIPVGSGLALAGAFLGATQLRELGALEELPALYAVQPAGCAPLVSAWNGGADGTAEGTREAADGEGADPGAGSASGVDAPDTIVGELEIPSLPASGLCLRALAETGGAALAVEDDAALSAGSTVAASEGLELSAAGATAAAGLDALGARDVFGDDDRVALLNPGAGNKDADVLRSFLMGQGV